ncbi:MAG TPA: hypothetical protein VMS12_07160 [Thermoanaerobaculia bacterium]|nr:hypothetical protein [Thermoanaerobaculia bacterium]
MTTSPDDLLASVVQAGIAATKERRYTQALALFVKAYGSSEGSSPDQKSKYVEGLSYYGLCLAREQKKFRPAIDFCKKAVEIQFYNAEHYANLTRVYLVAGTRKRAVDALQAGLRALPNDLMLQNLQKELGARGRPVIPFLSRDNPINIILGKAFRARKKKAPDGSRPISKS